MADIASEVTNIAQNTGQTLQSMAQRAEAKQGGIDFNQYTSALGAEAAFQQGAMPIIAATAGIMQRGQQINQAQQQIQLQSMAERTRQQQAGLQMQDHQLGLDDAATLSRMQSAINLIPIGSLDYDKKVGETAAQFQTRTMQGQALQLGIVNTFQDNQAKIVDTQVRQQAQRDRLKNQTNNTQLQNTFEKDVDKYNETHPTRPFNRSAAYVLNPITNAYDFDNRIARNAFDSFQAGATPVPLAPGLIVKETKFKNADGSETTYINPEANRVKIDNDTFNKRLGDISRELIAAGRPSSGLETADQKAQRQTRINELEQEKADLFQEADRPPYKPKIVPILSPEDRADSATLRDAIKSFDVGKDDSTTSGGFLGMGSKELGAEARKVLPENLIKQFDKATTAHARLKILKDYKAVIDKRGSAGQSPQTSTGNTTEASNQYTTNEDQLVPNDVRQEALDNVPVNQAKKFVAIVTDPENVKKDFVQRLLNPTGQPQIKNADGSYSSHLMGSDGDIAFPFIQRDPKTKQLIKMTEGDQKSGESDEAFKARREKEFKTAKDWALAHNEYIKFPNAKEADAFATNGYKVAFGIGEKKKATPSSSDQTVPKTFKEFAAAAVEAHGNKPGVGGYIPGTRYKTGDNTVKMYLGGDPEDQSNFTNEFPLK